MPIEDNRARPCITIKQIKSPTPSKGENRMKQNKWIALGLAAALSLGLFAGCAKEE